MSWGKPLDRLQAVPDPLIVTLVLLPLILAGLWTIERWITSRSSEAVASPTTNALQATTLVVLILAVCGRSHLGLRVDGPYIDQVLMGGLTGLLMLRVLLVVRAMAAVESSPGPGRPAWPFLALPLLVYVAVMPWAASARLPDGDEPYFLLITHSLVHDFDTELSNNYAEEDSLLFTSRALEPEWADPVRPDGRRYSRHSFLLPLILAPGYAMAGRWGAMLTIGVITAAAAWLTLGLARRYWGPDLGSEAIGAWALLALTPPLLLYSHQIWVEVPGALLVLVALERIGALNRGASASPRSWIVFGLVLVLLPLLKLRFALLSVPLAVLAWWRGGRSRRTLIWVGVATAFVVGGLLLYNRIVFGNPFKDHTLTQLLTIQGRGPSDYVQGLTGLFWDCAFGLLASNPLWLLLMPALVLLLWRRPPVLADLAICVVPYLAVVAPRREWYGAWAPPFRFGIVLLPLLALILVPLLRPRSRSGAQGLVVALGVLALGFSILWVVVPGWTYNLAVGTNHLLDHLAMRWAADAGRFLPSLVRPRTASWLVPLLASLLVTVGWWFPRRRCRTAGTWAMALLLLIVAALPLAATRTPTAVVEIEDRQVIKRGGELFPDPWEPYRPRFRNGWKLRPRESVSLPVVAGGKAAAIEIDLQRRARSSATLVIVAKGGDRLVASTVVEAEGGWQTLELGVVPWTAGTTLDLEMQASGPAAAGAELILDRVRFEWQ